MDNYLLLLPVITVFISFFIENPALSFSLYPRSERLEDLILFHGDGLNKKKYTPHLFCTALGKISEQESAEKSDKLLSDDHIPIQKTHTIFKQELSGFANRIVTKETKKSIYIASLLDNKTLSLISCKKKYLTSDNEFNSSNIKLNYNFKCHDEGYAICWSPHSMILVCGTNNGSLFVHNMHDFKDGNIEDSRSVKNKAHNSSVEDLCWSPESENVIIKNFKNLTIFQIFLKLVN